MEKMKRESDTGEGGGGGARGQKHSHVFGLLSLHLQRTEIAGMYKLLKGQPFDQDLFEIMLVSEPSLVNRLTKVSDLHARLH